MGHLFQSECWENIVVGITCGLIMALPVNCPLHHDVDDKIYPGFIATYLIFRQVRALVLFGDKLR